jgi:hypothetical protein
MEYLLLVTLLLLTTSSHAFLTFGTDGDCDFAANQLQDQLSNSPQTEFRLTNQQIFSAFSINGSTFKTIKGGYNTCALAATDTISTTKTTITGNSTTRVIRVSTVSNLTLENLIITDGEASNEVSFQYGGGIYIAANTTNNHVILNNITIQSSHALSGGGGMMIIGSVGFEGIFTNVRILNNSTNGDGGGLKFGGIGTLTLIDSFISDNSAQQGAGVSANNSSISTTGTTLILQDSSINQNTASNSGGGVYCRNIAVDMKGNSAISANTASSGAGAYLFTGCSMKSTSGDFQNSYGIFNNIATSSGGGITVLNGSRFDLIGDATHYANLFGNSTLENNSTGGGIFASGQNSFVRIINGHLNDNSSNSGGVAYINDKATLTMQRTSGSCFGNQICSEVSNNSTNNGKGAAFATETCGTLIVSQTEIYNNNAGTGLSVTYLSGNQNDICTSLFEGNIIHNNTGDTLFEIKNGYQLDFAFNTLTENNTINNPQTLFELSNLGSNQLNLNSSIIWNAPATVIDTHGNANNTVTGNCLGIHNSSTLPNGFGNLVTTNDPAFAVDSFSLSLASSVIDFCDTNLYTPSFHDIEGKVRGFNHPLVPTVLGPYDLGAFEFNPDGLNDVIFQGGF